MAMTDGLLLRLHGLVPDAQGTWALNMTWAASPKPRLALVNTGTIAVWCRTTTTAQGTALSVNVLQGGVNKSGYTIVRYSQTSTDRWNFIWTTTEAKYGFLSSDPGTGGPDNAAVLLVLVRNADTVKQYTNGALAGTHTGLGTALNAEPGTQPWYSGSAQCPVTSTFVWDRALSDSEVAELYQAGTDVFPEGGGPLAVAPFSPITLRGRV